LDQIGELRSGDACVAEYQQAGRGRRGRKWFSPFGANLYLSMYSRKKQSNMPAVSPAMVAIAAAVLVTFIGGLYFITHHKKEES
ncbi:hypothetical protein MJL48_34730, partial [Salmonella enterica subsp. enterica serovar Kentucky]|nr:hypothetical protein [Salmonella enterica subsp. enterica serovar Kentucky]